MRSEARDTILLGAFFIAYGMLVWWAQRASTIAQPIPETIRRRLEFARSRRDDMIAEENADGD